MSSVKFDIDLVGYESSASLELSQKLAALKPDVMNLEKGHLIVEFSAEIAKKLSANEVAEIVKTTLGARTLKQSKDPSTGIICLMAV